MYQEMTIPEFEYYLSLLGDKVSSMDEEYDIIVVGGYAILKYFSSEYRTKTRDIDFAYVEYYEDEDNTSLMQYAREIQEEYNLDVNWFNCDSAAHISDEIYDTITYVDTYGGIDIYIPSAEALLAMKTISARTKTEGSDYLDIPLLLEFSEIEPNIEELENNAKHYMPEEFRNRYTSLTQGKLRNILTDAGYNV